MDYPSCDAQVKRLADELWGESSPATGIAERLVGKGRIITGAGIPPGSAQTGGGLYPEGHVIRQVLDRIGVVPDFEAGSAVSGSRTGGTVRSTFISSPTLEPTTVAATCRFRLTGKRPELWDPVTGETRPALAFRQDNGRTTHSPRASTPAGRFSSLFRQPADELAFPGQEFPGAPMASSRSPAPGPCTSIPVGADRSRSLSRPWLTGPAVPRRASSTTQARRSTPRP